jgi:hypothetical protein
MVLGVDVSFAHDVLNFVNPGLESAILEDRRASVVDHFRGWDGGGSQRDDATGDFPYIYTAPPHFCSVCRHWAVRKNWGGTLGSAPTDCTWIHKYLHSTLRRFTEFPQRWIGMVDVGCERSPNSGCPLGWSFLSFCIRSGIFPLGSTG